jgi:hypothetical protein
VNAPFAWWWAALALGFAILAAVTSSNYGFAVPAAVVAVAFATAAVGETALRLVWRRRARATPYTPSFSDVQGWFRSGPLGREDIVRTLDYIERMTLRPNLPSCPTGELARLQQLRPEEFRRYVAARLAYLEGSS